MTTLADYWGSRIVPVGPLSSPRRPNQAGFSLLEVLVAFAILAVIMGVLLQIFSGAAQRATLAESYLKAATLAEAKLNELGVNIPLAPGILTGEPEGGFGWTLSVEPYPVEVLGDAGPNLMSLRVRVIVGWQESGHHHEISAATLRIASAER